jgi:hypothetical protein
MAGWSRMLLVGKVTKVAVRDGRKELQGEWWERGKISSRVCMDCMDATMDLLFCKITKVTAGDGKMCLHGF